MNGLQPSMREVRLPPRVLLGLGQIDVLPSQLIDYGKLGDTNERAMRMADFWLTVSASFLPPKSHSLFPELGGGC